MLSPTLGAAFQSNDIEEGLKYLSPGVLFFVINKVLIAIFNGKRQMKKFAIASSLRAFNILLFSIGVIFFLEKYYYFGAVFTVSEIVIFLVVLFMGPLKFYAQKKKVWFWITKNFKFGTKSIVHGLLSEAFIRVDVLMLGILLSDRLVGIYSFAAFFIEGIYQIPVVIRNLNNPILVKMIAENKPSKIIDFNRKTALVSFSFTFLVASLVAIIYPHFDLILPKETIDQSYQILLVLLSGMVIYSIFIPFDYIFLVGGSPGIQSIFMALNMTVNVGLNYLLIPQYGLLGASIGTFGSFLFASLLLNLLTPFFVNLRRGILIK